MMVSSTFTLEYIIDKDAEDIIVLNTPRDQLPEQLKKLGVAEEDWHELWDKVKGVADRANQREAAKKQLDQIISDKKKAKGENISWGFGKKKKEGKEPKKLEEELKKEAYDKDTEKGWTNTVKKANKWESKGVFARKMVDAHTDQVFGLEFECDVSKLQSNKVVLRYDFRREAWNLDEKVVPKELDSRGMDFFGWNRIWEMAQTALKHAQMKENEKKKIANKMKNTNLNLLFRGEIGDELEVKKYGTFMTKSLEDLINCDTVTEKAWKIIESKVQDICLPLGVMSSLLVHDTVVYDGGENFMYSGLELRLTSSNGGDSN